MHSWFCQGPGLGTRCLRVDSPWVYSICICVVCGLSYNSVWFHLSLVSTFNVGNTFILFDTIFINWHEYQPPTTETATSTCFNLLVLSSLSLSLIFIFIILFTDFRKQKGHDYRDLRFRQKSNYFLNCGLLNLA